MRYNKNLVSHHVASTKENIWKEKNEEEIKTILFIQEMLMLPSLIALCFDAIKQ